MSDQNNNNQQQNDSGKEHKKFEANVAKIAAVLGGKSALFNNTKADGSVLSAVVSKLNEKKKEALEVRILTGLEGLIENYTAFYKEVENKKKELQKAIADKEKEFNKKVDEFWKLVDSNDEGVKDMLKAIGAIASAEPAAEEGEPA